jgi:hypothetical protein
MNRGAELTAACEVREPRGMPCAESGDNTEAPTTARVTTRDRNIP